LKYRPLSNRTNVVITRNETFHHPDCTVFNTIEAALSYYNHKKREDEDIFIIGGGQIYDYSIQHDLVDEMYITEIDQEFEGDTYFTSFNETQWHKTLLLDHKIDEKNKYPFKVYHYTRKS
jgi:dihydrofolate reductase